MNTGLRDLDDRLRDHFRQGVVAIPDAEGVQRLLVCFYDAVNLFRPHRQSSLIGDKQPFLFQPILGLGGRGQPLDHMRSSLGSAGFTNQEDALKRPVGYIEPACATALPPLQGVL